MRTANGSSNDQQETSETRNKVCASTRILLRLFSHILLKLECFGTFTKHETFWLSQNVLTDSQETPSLHIRLLGIVAQHTEEQHHKRPGSVGVLSQGTTRHNERRPALRHRPRRRVLPFSARRCSLRRRWSWRDGGAGCCAEAPVERSRRIAQHRVRRKG